MLTINAYWDYYVIIFKSQVQSQIFLKILEDTFPLYCQESMPSTIAWYLGVIEEC